MPCRTTLQHNCRVPTELSQLHPPDVRNSATCLFGAVLRDSRCVLDSGIGSVHHCGTPNPDCPISKRATSRCEPPFLCACRAIHVAATDESATVRIAAARALHVSGRTKDAVALLMQAIEDENEFVRHAALNEIDEIGAAAVATKDLIEKMDKQNVYIRDLAAHALQQFAQ